MKIVCVPYPDPVGGHPMGYARDVIRGYEGGQTTPSPQAIDFVPGELLGDVSGGLGLRSFLEASRHSFVVTSGKDGAGPLCRRHARDTGVLPRRTTDPR